jgi:hypothetical protein
MAGFKPQDTAMTVGAPVWLSSYSKSAVVLA